MAEKNYGRSESGELLTESVIAKYVAEAEAGYDLDRPGTIIRRRGRPPRVVGEDGDLDARIDDARQRLESAAADRDALIAEALKRNWPQRRIASRLGVSLSTVSRAAKARAGNR